MYLKKTKKPNGRVYVSITESFRDADGVQRNRTVRSFGYLDDLEREWGPGALARCEAIRDEMTAEARGRNAPQALTIHPSEKVDMREDNRKNIGVAVPLSYYNLLGVERAVRNACRGRRLGFDCNAAMRLLVSDRLFDRGSKLSAWEGRGKWFFESRLTDDDVYRSLDVLAGARDSVVGAMNRSMAASGLREPGGNVFYDVTNYYFEVDEPDGLRRKGVSKEHRPDPIVQMGLLQDRNGLPITYRLFPGNTADCLTMIPVLADMKRDFGLERVIAVADKGLNCSDNIAALYARGDGFVFSQSIRGTKSPAELREWAVSEEGYEGRGGGFRVKSRQSWKTVTLKADSADGRPHKLRVPVKQVAFWSEKYARRAATAPRPSPRRASSPPTPPGTTRRSTTARPGTSTGWPSTGTPASFSTAAAWSRSTRRGSRRSAGWTATASSSRARRPCPTTTSSTPTGGCGASRSRSGSPSPTWRRARSGCARPPT